MPCRSADEGEVSTGDTLTMSQLGQLFGGVNHTAVKYILDTLEVSVQELHAGFNTVDVIMVLMFVSSHMEAGGVPLSLLDVIGAFCSPDRGGMDAAAWPSNVAATRKVPVARVERLIGQLEGGLDDIMSYVEEIVKPDTCEILRKEPEPTAVGAGELAQADRGGDAGGSRSGNLRGRPRSEHLSAGITSEGRK